MSDDFLGNYSTYKDFRENKCKCEDPEAVRENYEPMWHEWDLVCEKCNKLIRHCDAG